MSIPDVYVVSGGFRGAGRVYPVTLSFPLYFDLFVDPVQQHGRFWNCLVKGCTQAADYARGTLEPYAISRPFRPARGHWLRCAAHAYDWIVDAAPDFYAADRFHAYHAALIAYEQHQQLGDEERQIAEDARTREVLRAAEAEDMARNGFVIVCSGTLGILCRYPDGSLRADMRDLTEVPVCCSYHGQHVIQTLYRGKVAVPPHEDTCPQAVGTKGKPSE